MLTILAVLPGTATGVEPEGPLTATIGRESVVLAERRRVRRRVREPRAQRPRGRVPAASRTGRGSSSARWPPMWRVPPRVTARPAARRRDGTGVATTGPTPLTVPTRCASRRTTAAAGRRRPPSAPASIAARLDPSPRRQRDHGHRFARRRVRAHARLPGRPGATSSVRAGRHRGGRGAPGRVVVGDLRPRGVLRRRTGDRERSPRVDRCPRHRPRLRAVGGDHRRHRVALAGPDRHAGDESRPPRRRGPPGGVGLRRRPARLRRVLRRRRHRRRVDLRFSRARGAAPHVRPSRALLRRRAGGRSARQLRGANAAGRRDGRGRRGGPRSVDLGHLTASVGRCPRLGRPHGRRSGQQLVDLQIRLG